MKKLAVFDIDGTIAENGVIPTSVQDGCRHLQSVGYATTVATGRTFPRLKDVLGNDFDTIISPDALIAVEHGAKIVTRNGDIVFSESFGPQEVEHVHDFIRANIDMFCEAWFANQSTTDKIQYWVYDSAAIDERRQKYGHCAHVFSCSVGELKSHMQASPLCNVEVRFRPHVAVGELKLHFTRSNLDVMMGPSNAGGGIMGFIKNNVDKGLAVRYMINHLGLTTQDVLVAGNGINDLEMLNLSVKRRILVGAEKEREIIKGYLAEQDELIIIDSPDKLGDYLSTHI